MKGAALELEGVSRSYGAVVALNDVSVAIEPGEFLTLLGPSGSGKTTALMILAGFSRPDCGRVVMNGRDITNLPPHRRNFGIVFQSYALFPHMTVGKNVAFPLKMRKLRSDDRSERVRAALDMVDLHEVEHRYPHQLSGGQQQRVALARALVFEPSVMLMDEPLGALDRKLRQTMQLELKQLHDRLGMTIVYVTHDQEEALTMSDRIAVMHRGEILEIDAPARLYQRPETRFVADFIGESNFLEGPLETRAGARTVITASGTCIVIGEAAEPEPINGRVMLAIRPERVRVLSEPAESRPRNSFDAVITEAIFAGEVNRYVVELVGGEQLIVRESSQRGESRLKRGDKIIVGWDPEDAVTLRT